MTESTKTADLSALRIKRGNGETPKRKGPPWKIVLAIIAVFALVLVYISFRGTFRSAVEVELATVTLTYPSQASAVLNASGYVVAQQKASVASKGTGRLAYLGVEEGDQVKKGQVIARLESDDVEAALAKATADLQLAKADQEEARLNLDRQTALYARALTSKAALDAATAGFGRVEAAIKSAEAAVRAAEVAGENTRIRAPFDGTVLTKTADVGEVVAPFGAAANARGAVATIADMNSLEVEADVSESNITRVRPGQPCEIVLDAYPDVRYQGYVSKIVPTADRAKATVMTKVKFKNRDQRVLPEMSAKVTFLSAEIPQDMMRAAPKLTMPASALVRRDAQQIVFRVQNETALETAISTGERIGDRIEVTSGLNSGDQVVTRPGPSLADGDKVKTKS